MACRPHTPVKAAGFHDDQLPYLKPLLRQLVSDHKSHIAWFYTPHGFTAAGGLDPCLIVYDCMDELAAFKRAKQLLQRDNALFKVADIVLPAALACSGRSVNGIRCTLFSEQRGVAHFAQALDRAAVMPYTRICRGHGWVLRGD